MKKIIPFLLALIVLTGAGCQQAEETINNQKPNEPRFVLLEGTPPFEGEWIRQEILVDGVKETGDVTATLIFNENGTFTSKTNACMVEGTYTATESKIHMLTEETDCPEFPGQPTDDITYNYTISEDGKIMTNTTIYSGIELKEVYHRPTE